jgi:hypothetical protein
MSGTLYSGDGARHTKIEYYMRNAYKFRNIALSLLLICGSIPEKNVEVENYLNRFKISYPI